MRERGMQGAQKAGRALPPDPDLVKSHTVRPLPPLPAPYYYHGCRHHTTTTTTVGWNDPEVTWARWRGHVGQMERSRDPDGEVTWARWRGHVTQMEGHVGQMASPRARWTGGEAVRHDSSNSSPVITSRPYLALSCRILAGDGAGGSLAAASAAAARLVAWVGATFSASQQAMCSSALPLTPASSATVAGDGEGRPFGVREVRVVVALFRWYSSELVPAFASSWGGSGAIVTAILRSPQGSIDSRPEP
eukprot:CAMPEP_0181246700 /NCGR_PEP_ID=MMETSP1096-20121128/44145_1 /TAXON_ID=156174 ORGANISM="Chrysochromulina ericina, Strain CCMP281" /NCGR_SAMPLE_ID=MMETSP1096 /ASSEMBLY_ACC=CAM_ASM_000453 /LENGTH=247 /DNA_ID=CAMNT_0023343557 /DNA_START=355 /DNA_END=1096 /DNA_ORIENTATION=-